MNGRRRSKNSGVCWDTCIYYYSLLHFWSPTQKTGFRFKDIISCYSSSNQQKSKASRLYIGHTPLLFLLDWCVACYILLVFILIAIVAIIFSYKILFNTKLSAGRAMMNYNGCKPSSAGFYTPMILKASFHQELSRPPLYLEKASNKANSLLW